MKALSRRQMLALMFVAMLSPFLRLIPRQVALFAGRAAWTAPFLAFVPLLLLAAALEKILKAAPKHGLGEASCQILGGGLGKAVLVIWSVWLCFQDRKSVV